jgi:hypothetical protein
MQDGLYCDGGWRWISMGSEGNMYPCNALLYNTDYFIGNIFKDDVILDKRFMRCPFQKCEQVCDRHWSRKKIVKNDIVTDEEDVNQPQVLARYKNPLSLLFAPTWRCNYSCKYCGLPEKKHFPDIPNACDTHDADKWIEALSNFFDANDIDGGIWHTNGGEPLYYKGIDRLLKFMSDRSFKIGLTTNLSYDVYNRIISQVPPDREIDINCSLHPSDKRFDWTMFKSRLKLLVEFGYAVSVNFVGHPDQIMLAPEYKSWCEDNGCKFELIPFIGNIDGMYFPNVESFPEPIRKVVYQITKPELQDSNRFQEGKRSNDRSN